MSSPARMPSLYHAAASILGELSQLRIRCVECSVEISPPLDPGVLPASALRSILGNHLHDRAPALFQEFFEPGKAHGHKLPAFAICGPLPSPGASCLSFRITTWDREGLLLPSLLEMARLAENDTRYRHRLRKFTPEKILEGRIASPLSEKPASGMFLFVLDGPLVIARRTGSKALGNKRPKVPLQASQAGLADLVAGTLHRLSDLSYFYGPGTLDWRNLSVSDIATECSGVASHFADFQARGLRKEVDSNPKLVGFIGHVEIRNPGPALIATMVTASVLGLGKNTVEGCGAASFRPMVLIGEDLRPKSASCDCPL